jgi:hypothetical protein
MGELSTNNNVATTVFQSKNTRNIWRRNIQLGYLHSVSYMIKKKTLHNKVT